MAQRIATVGGYALRPGTSRNGRLYTAGAIAKMVERASERIRDGGGLDIVRPADPMSQRTHHAAEDDSTRIVGRLTGITLAEDGSARFTADIADTTHGRDIASLVSPHVPGDPNSVPPFLTGVSIRGAWVGPVRRIQHDGRTVETGDDLELDGLDYTGRPGVPGAGIDSYTPATRAGRHETAEPAADRVPIYESVQEVLVTAPVQEKGAPALQSGKPAAAPTKATTYADLGYQDDGAKRYALDTKAQAKAAWSYINQASNAKNYTAPQLKRVRGRITKALTKFGVKVDPTERWLIEPAQQLTEAQVAEDYPGASVAGSFRVVLCNGPVTVTVSSYCVDPADLDLVGRSAMDGACQALAAIDPDMDGDMDVPAEPAEDTDDDNMETTDPPPDPVVEDVPPDTPRTPAAGGGSGVSDPVPADPAADHTTQEEDPAMAEPTTPPVEQPPAEPAPVTTPAPVAPAQPATAPVAPSGVHLTDDQFQQMMAALRQPAMAAAESVPAPATETTLAVPPVAETDEQRIARMVQEGIKAALPLAVQEHVQATGGPTRKGLVAQPVTETTAESAGEDLGEFDVPADWPQKPLHKYTEAERRRFVAPALQNHVLGSRAGQQ